MGSCYLSFVLSIPFWIRNWAADAFFCVPVFDVCSPSFFCCFSENNLIILVNNIASPNRLEHEWKRKKLTFNAFSATNINNFLHENHYYSMNLDGCFSFSLDNFTCLGPTYKWISWALDWMQNDFSTTAVCDSSFLCFLRKLYHIVLRFSGPVRAFSVTHQAKWVHSIRGTSYDGFLCFRFFLTFSSFQMTLLFFCKGIWLSWMAINFFGATND